MPETDSSPSATAIGVGDYVRILRYGEVDKFEDYGMVLEIFDDVLGPRVAYHSAKTHSRQIIARSRVSLDRWGPVRHGWDTIAVRLGEQHIIVQISIFVAVAAAALWLLAGVHTALTSSTLYRVSGAVWAAAKFGIGWALLGFGVFMVLFLIDEKWHKMRWGEGKEPGTITTAIGAIGAGAICVAFAAGAIYGSWYGWVHATIATSIEEIRGAPDYYDGNGVSVDGRLSGYRHHISRRGNAYVTATLCNGGQCVRIFEWGDGDDDVTSTGWAEVWGTYETVNHVGEYAFPNEVVANDIASVDVPSADDSGP